MNLFAKYFFGQGKQRRDCRNWRELRFAVSSRRCQMSRSLKWFIISSVQVHCLATEYFVTNQQLFLSEIQALQNELTPKVFQNTQTWTWRQIAVCVTDFKNCFPGREIIFAHHLGCFQFSLQWMMICGNCTFLYQFWSAWKSENHRNEVKWIKCQKTQTSHRLQFRCSKAKHRIKIKIESSLAHLNKTCSDIWSVSLMIV